MNVMRKLITLHVKDNDYLAFQRRFRYLIARHKELTSDSENFYHDLFLIGLREHQKAFVKTRLDEFFATGQDLITNININDLMKQLTNRMSKIKDERLKPQRANTATMTVATTSFTNSNSDFKCEICHLK
ncbi:hypothetical protein AJ78_06374 [Emergomyces pasteurianus Ep9510]|uniref:Uncharacterized protein n=1 Tax=Emergomyces pasteurianus Ep9510 TaxID=1447872 RepID=A0A1J9P942_9EURO|nr:hypothetical protein AJ78_06374 [Emergomyces pasteurianus Ep9510]